MECGSSISGLFSCVHFRISNFGKGNKPSLLPRPLRVIDRYKRGRSSHGFNQSKKRKTEIKSVAREIPSSEDGNGKLLYYLS